MTFLGLDTKLFYKRELHKMNRDKTLLKALLISLSFTVLTAFSFNVIFTTKIENTRQHCHNNNTQINSLRMLGCQ